MTVDLMSPPWWTSPEQWEDEIMVDRIRATARDLGHSERTVSDVLGVLERHGTYCDEQDLINAARHCLRQNFEPTDAILAALCWQSKGRDVDPFQVVATLPIWQRSTYPDRTGEYLTVGRFELSPVGAELWADHQRGEVGTITGRRQVAAGLEVYATIDAHRRDLAALAVAERLTCSAGFRIEDAEQGSEGTVAGRGIVHEVSLVTGERGASLHRGATVRLGRPPAAPPRRLVTSAERRRLLDEARRDGNRIRECGPDGWRTSAPIGRVLSVG